MRVIHLVVLILLMNNAVAAEDLYVTTRSLSAASAAQLALATEQACAKKGFKVAVAVVDRQGNLLAFVRNPLSGNHTIKGAQAKAYTSATLLGPTIELTKSAQFLKDAPGILLLGGGVPIQVAGHIYGAVGVAGAPPDKLPGDLDEVCAHEGMAHLVDQLEFAE